MYNFIFEKFKKDQYGNFTNQLVSSHIHNVKPFKRFRNFKWGQLAKILYDELARDYTFSKDKKRLILNILATAIDKPDMAMRVPNLEEYCIDGFKDFLGLLDKLEDAHLVKRLTNCEDENGSKKPFVLYPTISSKKLLDILKSQESQTFKMKKNIMERSTSNQ